MVALNRGPFLGAQPPLELLDGPHGQLLDVRPAGVHAAGHAPGAVNVPLDGASVGTKAASCSTTTSRSRSMPRRRRTPREAARRLNAVGLLGVAGFVLELETPERVEPVGIDELEALLEQDSAEVLDVREKDERDEGYIPGSAAHPLPPRARLPRRARRPAGGHDLLDRRARRRGRERARRRGRATRGRC